MKKFLQKKLKDEKGLTLIELLAVIVILAIIAAIAIPAIGNIIENSRVGAIKSDALNIMSSAELYFIDNPDATNVKLTDLKTKGFVDDTGSIAVADTVIVTKAVKAVGATAAVPAKFKGIGKTGKIQVAFNEATKADISKYANSDRGTVTGISTVTAGPITD